ncbi:hypothetical protein FACS189442_4040 [Spirochaetia bacterium]|nr:hypothetical protein FACS189442_4040 [Spirochaetia bacterium]
MTRKNAAYFICLNLILMTLIGCDSMAALFHGDKPEVPSSNDNNNNPVPGIPSGLKTTVLSKNEIMVSWTAVNGANTYEVYDGSKSHTTAFPYTVIGGLNPDTSYQFSVRAGNSHGWSGASSPVSGKTQGADTMETPTEAPGGLSTETLSSAEIRVNWNTVSGANSYMVFYGTETAGSSQYGGTTSGLSLTITGLEPGTTYYFTVKAGNSAGWSAGSAPVSGTSADLAAPSGLNVSAQFSTSMDISWNAVSGAASYKIYRDNSAAGISNTAAYTDTGLTAGTTYSYKVSAVSSNGTEGPQSSSVSGTTLAPSLDPLPGPPEGVGITVLSFAEIRVSWNAVSGADSYMVYYGTEATGSSQYGGTASGSPFTVTGLQPGTAYYFTVKAGNSAGWSDGSSPVSGTTAVLAVPSGLSVSTQSSEAMSISWNAVSGASSYNIYRSNSSSGPFTGIGAGNTTAYTDTGLTANTTYWYKVSAVNGTEGAQSGAVSGTTNDIILAAPTGLSAAAQSRSGMTISWSAVSGAASYKIYRLNSSTGTFTNIGASNTTSYSDTGLTADTMYYYAINAVTGGGTEGTRSETVSGITLSVGTVVTTLAGSGAADYADGTGTAAKFNYPRGVAVDNAGNVYVADTENGRIRKISPSGVVTTLAGSGDRGYADGTGTAARFYNPRGVAVDNAGNVYVADTSNHRIRKISPGGVVTTLAGSGTSGYADGTGTAARFYSPTGVAVDNAGNVYVADYGNNRIRKISPSGVVTTLAGSTQGYADGTGTAARFDYPFGVAADNAGNVYVADYGNHRIRKISPSGVVTTLAGSGAKGYADRTGTAAKFNNPSGVAVDNAGNVYVADYYNHRIRKISPSGVVTTLAGIGYGYADGTATAAEFSFPYGVAVDNVGTVYVADTENHLIRKIEQ